MDKEFIFGLKEETIIAINDVFAQYPQIKKSVVFGSRAKGNHRDGSDIDICLFGEIDLPLLHKIEESIDELNLPYTVDLVVYDRIQNQDLKERTDRVGVGF
ncbi:nucleotidyltransferase domain-containing protein [Seleniivibrio sp.]|uniref:nucleotidyltransferase family protein n=1 Tax=Seleniivibrio sp. TaxID=2898801 RepID=UPI0025D9A5CC|nr:nucleotidyltransferase domain-containing protein [Seleniivibrio sp.]MCD8553385.1 nucleotidyltransferase domain-containing protein [Seleniivibrio sp.]